MVTCISGKQMSSRELYLQNQFRDKLTAEVKELEGQLKKADQNETSQLEQKIDRRRKRSEAIAKLIESYQENENDSVEDNRKQSQPKKNTNSQ